MSKRNFDKWLDTFRDTINGYDFYVNFDTVYKNAKKHKVELNILNSLIGSTNIKKDFKNVIKKYPECLKAIPILIAVRNNEIFCQDEKGAVIYNFKEKTQSIDEYCYFMEKTGLFELLSKHIINNVYDYVTGVEVGLSSNGRKNRGGTQMENLVEGFLKQAKADYYTQMTTKKIKENWNIDLTSIVEKENKIKKNKKAEKRYDFVVKTKNTIYVIEVNFYSTQGSKLNETSRSYKMIAEESKKLKGVEFIWITDGKGWHSAKNNLEETFDVFDNMYNLNDLENNILSRVLK